MKKGIIVLLIAVLVSGFAFAKLSGNAGITYEANFGKTDFEFVTENKQSLDFSFTFASENVEVAGDEDIHVEVAASAKFILGTKKPGAKGVEVVGNNVADRGIGIVASLDKARIVGKNWYVDVTGTQSAYDYAKAAVLTIKNKDKKDDFGNAYDVENQAASYVAGYAGMDGVTVGFNGFTFSGGLDYYKDTTYNLSAHLGSATIETPEFAFNDDAVKVQAAGEFSRFALGLGATKVIATAAGASAKATVAIQDITLGVAADMGLDYLSDDDNKDTQFNVDARVDFKYNFVDASVYMYAGKDGLEYGEAVDETIFGPVYASYEDFYLEAKVAFDLNAFELPLKVTASAKNITNSNPAGVIPAVKVEFAKDAITAGASFDINTETKAWNALAYGTYAFEKFTAGAGVYVKGATELSKVGLAAFAESTKLVNGATFGLSYGLNAGEVYKNGGAKCIADAGKYVTDYKKDPVAAGNLVAYCKIAF